MKETVGYSIKWQKITWKEIAALPKYDKYYKAVEG